MVFGGNIEEGGDGRMMRDCERGEIVLVMVVAQMQCKERGACEVLTTWVPGLPCSAM